MRIIITTFLLLIFISCFSQSNHSHDGILKKTLPVIPYTNFNEDSLMGFNENKLQEEIIEEKLVEVVAESKSLNLSLEELQSMVSILFCET